MIHKTEEGRGERIGKIKMAASIRATVCFRLTVSRVVNLLLETDSECLCMIGRQQKKVEKKENKIYC